MADLELLSNERCEAINKEQREGQFHPLTCGNNRGDAAIVACRRSTSGSGKWGTSSSPRRGPHRLAKAVTPPGAGWLAAKVSSIPIS